MLYAEQVSKTVSMSWGLCCSRLGYFRACLAVYELHDEAHLLNFISLLAVSLCCQCGSLLSPPAPIRWGYNLFLLCDTVMWNGCTMRLSSQFRSMRLFGI